MALTEHYFIRYPELYTPSGMEGMMGETKTLYSLNPVETQLAIRALRSDPQMTTRQFLWSTNRQKEKAKPGDPDANLLKKVEFDSSFDGRLSTLVEQSRDNLRDFIKLGNYHLMAYRVGVAVGQHRFSLSESEDVAQEFWMRRMDYVIDKYDSNRGTFDTLMTRNVHNFLSDIKRNRNLQTLMSVQQADTVEVDWQEYDFEDPTEPLFNHDALVKHITSLEEEEFGEYKTQHPTEAILEMLQQAVLEMLQKAVFDNTLAEKIKGVNRGDVSLRNMWIMYASSFGKTSDEISQVLGVSRAAINTRKWRAIKAIRHLDQETIDDIFLGPIAA